MGIALELLEYRLELLNIKANNSILATSVEISRVVEQVESRSQNFQAENNDH